MSLQDEILKRMKLEITNDPDGVGYAGKTDDEVMQLLNNPVAKQRIVFDYLPAPINKILSGLKEAPNVVATSDVTSSLKVSVDVAQPDIGA